MPCSFSPVLVTQRGPKVYYTSVFNIKADGCLNNIHIQFPEGLRKVGCCCVMMECSALMRNYKLIKCDNVLINEARIK